MIAYNDSLKPDGCFIANTYGINSFKELKIVLNLAESEREGGISPNIVPYKEMSELGNLLSRTGYNLTTLNMTKYSLQFSDFSQICDFLKSVGENNFLINRRRIKSRETFIAAAAIYKTLFNNKKYGIEDFRSVHVNFCNYVNEELKYFKEEEIKDDSTQDYLIMSLEIANLIGWKYHESQQKPKRRGSAEINLKDITTDLLSDNPDEEVKFGRISLKKGLAPEEEDYEIIEETERLKELIKSKLGEDKLEEKLKSINENKKELKDQDNNENEK